VVAGASTSSKIPASAVSEPIISPPETGGSWGFWKAPELPALLFLALLLALLALPHSPTLRDLDVGWLIQDGEYILNTHRLPAGDIYSFTNYGRPWILYKWGYELYLGAFHHLAGLGGVVWANALLIALTYSLLLYYLLRLGVLRWLACGLVALAVLTNINSFLTRPTTFTYFLYALALFILEDYRRKPGRQLWALPPLFLLWANVHLGFIVALGAVGLYGLSAWLAPSTFRGTGTPRDRTFLLIFPLCLAAVCINPYGVHLLVKIFLHSSENLVLKAMTLEMKSPNFHQGEFFPLFLQMVLLFWVGGREFPGRPVLLALVTVTLALGLYSLRHVPYFSITATLYLAQGFMWPAKKEDQVSPGKYRHGWGWAMLGAILSLMWVVGIEHKSPGFYQFEDSYVPRRVADYLASQTGGPRPLRIFSNSDQWSSYFIYRLTPRARVFIDTRFDLYGDAFIQKWDALRTKALRNPEVLAPWQVDFLVIKKKSLPFGQAPVNPRWPLVYEDDQALVYRPLPTGKAQPPGGGP
jgi:hypothetical protein